MEITELSIEELKDKAVKIRIELDEERDTMCIDNYEEVKVLKVERINIFQA